ncbi:MAG TPA: ABC transporter substrate-binding protein [Candidatus Limnocylindria bacterium]|nr:ABC transporter substrate-binding protein [Candidatus Limnocylindria bacterium]
MLKRKHNKIGALFFALAVLVFVDTAPGQEGKRVRFGYPSLGFRQGHIWVAKDAGLFKRYGLDVEPIFLRGGQLAIQALAGGDPPLMSIGQVVQAGLAGFDLVLIAGVEIYYDSTVFARPEITRLEQLKGKRIGISGFGAATHFAAIILAQHLKLDPEKDMILVPGGPDAERMAAMTTGKIDAAIFNSSTVPVAKRMGLVELVKIPDLKVEVQGNGMATTRTFIKSNRDVVKSALKGYIEGIHYIFANKKESQKIFGKYMRTTDPEVLESSYQAYVTTTPKRPYPTLKGLQFLLDRMVAQMPQAKTAKPEQFVDMSFLNELDKEGFFNEMAKRYPGK